MEFVSTPRGARLARRLVAKRLHAWGHPYGSDGHDAMALIAAELVANAVRHGHLPGHGFRLCLTASPEPTPSDPSAVILRIAVTDPRGARRPVPRPAGADAEDGRGLLLVSRLADRWGVTTGHPGSPGRQPPKTVWAELVTAPATPSAEPGATPSADVP